MKLKEDRVFLAAVVVSVILHVWLLGFEVDIFGERDQTVYIPVSMASVDELEKAQVAESKEMVVPELPASDSEGAVTRRGSLSALEDRYIEAVAEEIERRKFTPDESRYYGLIGNVVVGFVLGPQGRFHDMRIVRSSGDELLDATALGALAATDGHVKRPAWAGSRDLAVSLVVKYQYRL